MNYIYSNASNYLFIWINKYHKTYINWAAYVSLAEQKSASLFITSTINVARKPLNISLLLSTKKILFAEYATVN